MIESPGILIDTTRCNGCETCILACKQENGLGPDKLRPGQQAVDGLSSTRFSTILRRPGGSFVRHMCRHCQRTYSESSALLVRGSWYAREVHRCAVDHWQHLGTSLRRTAEVLRSWMGRQERYRLWKPLCPAAAETERCSLAASTVHRWLDQAVQVA